MFRRDDEHEFVEIDYDRVEAGFLRLVGKYAELRVVAQNVVGNMAAESALDLDLNHGMQAAELREEGKQIEHRKFVGGDDQLAFLQFAQLGERLGSFPAQVDQ